MLEDVRKSDPPMFEELYDTIKESIARRLIQKYLMEHQSHQIQHSLNGAKDLHLACTE
jgi:hypothetical protein